MPNSNNVSADSVVNPLVSIVVLSHNRPQYLEHALKSILCQSYSHVEVVVVDNPSPNTPLIRELVGRYPTVKLVEMKANVGYTGGMNEGIRQTRGDYIYLTEDDIVSAPESVEHMLTYLRKNPGAGIVSGVLFDDHGAMISAGGFVNLRPIYSQK